MVSCIPAVASWHDSDTVRRLPAAVAAVAVAAAAVAAVAVAAVVAATVACTAPSSAPCWKTTKSVSDVLYKHRLGPPLSSVADPDPDPDSHCFITLFWLFIFEK